MRTSLFSLQTRRWFAPVALMLLALIVYLPLIYRLGFYWDDWPSIWFYHLWGPSGFLQSFASDRPALAWMFMLTTTMLGESPAGWQLFGLLARWIAAVILWWTLLGIWPYHSRQVTWMAALFLVYPGFSQQYISVTYSNAFLVMALALSSLGSMIWAYRRIDRQPDPQAGGLTGWGLKYLQPLWLFSLLSQVAALAMTEYFFGFELLRPFFLWLAYDNSALVPTATADETETRFSVRIKTVLLRWSPYLVVAAPFFIDRIFFHKTPRGVITLFEGLSAGPLRTLSGLLSTIGSDFIEVNFLAWFHRLDPALIGTFDRSIQLLFGATILGAFVLACTCFLWMSRPNWNSPASPDRPTSDRRWGLQATALGVIAFLACGWSIWATNLHIELLFPWDRFTLITMLGTSLLIAGLTSLLLPWRWAQAGLLAALIGLACGLQFQHRLVYRQEWLLQRSFLWQLAWRIPALEPGTVLLTSELPFTYFSDNSLTAPINWMYAPQNTSTQMPHLLYDVEARYQNSLPAIAVDQPIKNRYRATVFEGSTSQAVVVFFDPPRCVKVIDPTVDRFLPVKPLYIREMTPLSDPTWIRPNNQSPAEPPQAIFGAEPPHSWCYYFEKAELYGQVGNWTEAARMADRALEITKHFTDKNVSELFPFVEAYAHTGDWRKAVDLSRRAYESWDKTQYPLCDVWTRILNTTSDTPERGAAIQKIEESLQCKLR